MAISHGQVKCGKLKKIKSVPRTIECLLCSQYMKECEKLTCTHSACDLVAHITCLADLFLNPGEYVPIEGKCPFCETRLLWGDLIKIRKSYEDSMEEKVEVESNESDDDVVCTQEKGFVDNNSWFLDCNDEL